MSKRIQPFTAVSALWRVVTARVVYIVLRLGVFSLPPTPPPPPAERAPPLSRSLSRPLSSACLHAHGLARSCGSWCERRGECSWQMMCIRMRLWLTIFIVRCRLKPPPCFEPLLERMRGCAYFPWRGAGGLVISPPLMAFMFCVPEKVLLVSSDSEGARRQGWIDKWAAVWRMRGFVHC